jgi:uncharacterized protein DUF397
MEVYLMINSTRELRWRTAKRCSGANCVEVARDGDYVLVRDSKNPQNPPVTFTGDEWAVFTAGVREGDFDFA